MRTGCFFMENTSGECKGSIMDHLLEYERLQAQAQRYRKAYRAEIERGYHERRRCRILERFLQFQNVSVWCRNGDICDISTHCITLDCPYKTAPDDVAMGCAECQRFLVTTVSDDWNRAQRLFDPYDNIY